MDADTDHDIAEVRWWAAATPAVIRLWLFGSRARGDHRPDSDLDIAIEHEVVGNDEDILTAGLCEVPLWQAELQPGLALQLQLESRHDGAAVIDAGLR